MIKTGLALSGGGAVGAGHIGIIEEIEKAGIPIDIIGGTSAGAVIALVYSSCGVTGLNEFFEEFASGKRSLILELTPGRFINRLSAFLKNYVSAKTFSDLAVEFICAATDFKTGSTVILNQGDPIKAVLASAAYPGVFPSQKINGNILVDGGISKNIPADSLKEFGAKFVICSSLYKLEQLSEYQLKRLNRVGMLIRAVDIIQARASAFETKNCDFCFLPEVGSFQPYEFYRLIELREIGRKYAAKVINRLKKEYFNCRKKDSTYLKSAPGYARAQKSATPP